MGQHDACRGREGVRAATAEFSWVSVPSQFASVPLCPLALGAESGASVRSTPSETCESGSSHLADHGLESLTGNCLKGCYTPSRHTAVEWLSAPLTAWELGNSTNYNATVRLGITSRRVMEQPGMTHVRSYCLTPADLAAHPSFDDPLGTCGTATRSSMRPPRPSGSSCRPMSAATIRHRRYHSAPARQTCIVAQGYPGPRSGRTEEPDPYSRRSPSACPIRLVRCPARYPAANPCHPRR
jgi:hypothetical protein